MRTLVKAGALSVAVAGLVLAGGCVTVGGVGPAARNNPTRMDYLHKVSTQVAQVETQVNGDQARLENLSGQTRTHLADKLAAVRLDLFHAQRDLRSLRRANDASQWKQDRGQLKTALHQVTHSVSVLDHAMKKA